MTKDFYVLHFGLLLKYLGLKPDNEKTSMYWEFLKHMDDNTFHTAVQEIIKNFIPTTQNPFPLVSHFLKYCGSDAQGEAVKAISTLKAYIRCIGKYESVNFNDNALHETVERFGGWPAVCEFSDKDWNVNEGRMIDTYKVMQQSSRNEIHHLAGLSEKDNGCYRIYDINQKTMQTTGHNRILRGVLLETIGETKPLLNHKKQEAIEDNSENFDMNKFFESLPTMKENN